MMFFEGFSSVFPYIIYLLLIWICLIFGLRTQILEAIHLSPSKNLIIDKKANKTNDNIIIQYFDYSRHTVKSFINDRTEPRAYTFCLVVSQKIKLRPLEIGPFKNSHLFSSHTHRGPPVLVG
jgi:hypothetical protein